MVVGVILSGATPALAQDARHNESPDAASGAAPDAASDAESGAASDAETGGGSVHVVDFGEEEGFGVGEVMTTQDPRPLEHESLLRKRYRGPDPQSADRAALAAEHTSPAAGIDKGVTIGVNAGVSMAGFAGPGAAKTRARVGGTVGALLLYRISRRLALQPEIAFAVKGALDRSTLDSNTSGTARLAYVSVPVLLRVLIPVGNVELAAGLGPSLGVALNSQVERAEIARLDLGVSTALGVIWRAGRNALAVDLRYEEGMAGVIASSADMDSANMDGAMRNRTLSLSLGYLF